MLSCLPDGHSRRRLLDERSGTSQECHQLESVDHFSIQRDRQPVDFLREETLKILRLTEFVPKRIFVRIEADCGSDPFERVDLDLGCELPRKIRC